MTTVALRVTETGGRHATTRHILPKTALAVGMPSTPAPKGWRWSSLTELARLESGHTPSRRHPEYWGGSIPWIGIQDARANDGRRIEDTQEKTNELGIENSSARVLPENTVCLSRTASVGYVVVMGRPMATSQDFVNWVCSTQLDHNFLKYLFIAEEEDLLRFASGSVHPTIYFPEVKAFHICHPSVPEQQRIVGILDEAFEGIATSKTNAEKNLQNSQELFNNYLQSVFTNKSNGWEMKKLSDVAEYFNGLTYSPKDVSSNGTIVLRSSNIQNDSLDFSDIVRVKCPVKEKILVKDGDILMCSRNGSRRLVGKTAVIQNLGEAMTFGTFMMIIRSQDNHYLTWFFKSSEFRSQISRGENTMINQITRYMLDDISILFPPAFEQKAIVEKMVALSDETQRLTSLYERKLTALEALKKSLLHQAFTGQL